MDEPNECDRVMEESRKAKEAENKAVVTDSPKRVNILGCHDNYLLGFFVLLHRTPTSNEHLLFLHLQGLEVPQSIST